jgi:flagellar biosynthesis protein FlhG
MKPPKKPVPRIISICGGKGGVGKSTIAVNLSLAIGRLGHRVVLVDADLGTANLHTMLGITRPEHGLADFFDQTVETLDETRIDVVPPNVSLVAGTSRPGAAQISHGDKGRLLRGIARLDADVVIIDVGAGASFNIIDLIAVSDLKLFVVTPQLPSIHNAFALLKACVHRVVRKLAHDETGKAMIDAAVGNESKARTIVQLVDALRGLDAELADGIDECLARFGVGLIGNKIGAEIENSVLTRISQMLYDQLHVRAPVLASVKRASALGGGLRAGHGTIVDSRDPSHAVFRALAQRLLEIDLGILRGEQRVNRQRTLPLWIQRELDATPEAEQPALETA